MIGRRKRTFFDVLQEQAVSAIARNCIESAIDLAHVFLGFGF